jgi:hypothetical protein
VTAVADGRRAARFSEAQLAERDARLRFRGRCELEAEAAAEGLAPHRMVDEYELLVDRSRADERRAALLALNLAVRGDYDKLAWRIVDHLRRRAYWDSIEAEAG